MNAPSEVLAEDPGENAAITWRMMFQISTFVSYICALSSSSTSQFLALLSVNLPRP